MDPQEPEQYQIEQYEPEPEYQPPQYEPEYEPEVAMQEQEYIFQQHDYMQQINALSAVKSQDQSTNSQYEMKDLIKRIYRQTKQLNQLTYLGFDGSLLLYYICQWHQDKCNTMVIQGSDIIKQIRKQNQLSAEQGKLQGAGFCNVCCCESLDMVKNICGHKFCKDCWIQYLTFVLDDQPQNPLPKCMQIDCLTRITHTVCQLLSSYNNHVKEKIIEVMCRSYAMNNKSVKMCKGRPGKNCTRCFTVQKMFAIIECEACGNIVCPRCGERSHGPSVCLNLSKWKIIKQTTMGLVQYYEYQYCPNCRNAVERTSGCNQIKCRCGVTFCYICGQKWHPHHPTNENGADYCPNYKKLIKTYRDRKMRRKKNIIKFCLRIQAKQEQLSTLQEMLLQIDRYKDQLATIIKQLMKYYPFHQSELRLINNDILFLKKTICLLWGEALADYFMHNERSKFFCQRIRQSFQAVYKFSFEFILKMYKILTQEPSQDISEAQYLQIKKQKQSFYKQYFQKMKILAQSKENVRKIAKQEYDCLIFE